MTNPSRRAARLLLTESDEIVPLLRSTDPAAFDRPTCLPLWSVRDVLAHCSAVLVQVGSGIAREYTPEANEVDVVARRPWPVTDVIDELERAYAAGARAIDGADGALDGVGLGEWVHGGDVRDALGLARPYGSAGIDDALVLLAERSVLRATPTVRCELSDAAPLVLGSPDSTPVGTFAGPAAALVRLLTGRPLPESGWSLEGLEPADLRMFS